MDEQTQRQPCRRHGFARQEQHGGTRPHSAEGSWRIEDGAYCVKMQWPLAEEPWCRHLYQVGNKYYGVRARGDDTAPAMEVEFSR